MSQNGQYKPVSRPDTKDMIVEIYANPQKYQGFKCLHRPEICADRDLLFELAKKQRIHYTGLCKPRTALALTPGFVKLPGGDKGRSEHAAGGVSWNCTGIVVTNGDLIDWDDF